MPIAAICSFRLGGTDGVSVVAANWARMLRELGFEVVTVAGEGPVDRLVEGLAIDASQEPSRDQVHDALADASLVVVENLCTIPLNLPAARRVAEELSGRPAILHHHDPPWQRTRFQHVTELPSDDPAWAHVVINDLTARQFAARGIPVRRMYNGFEVEVSLGDRSSARSALGFAPEELIAVHPVRAIARKNIPGAIEVCERLGATYWLPGPAEEGYGAELEGHLAEASVPVSRARVGTDIARMYAASDLVLFPSLWEGFGNPPVEAAIHRRPAVVGDYPVAHELRQLGFRWFHPEDHALLASFLDDPDDALLEHNLDVVRRHLSLDVIERQLGELLAERGWSPDRGVAR